MTKIEETHRALYDALAKVRKAKKHPKATDALETALEAHLEELQRFEYPDLKRQLAGMTKERDECQERMRALDEAYGKSQQALAIAGDELRHAQEVGRALRIEVKSLNQQLEARVNTIIQLRKTYGTDQSLADAREVIGQQEQLIAGQRHAIAGMHSELTHLRVVCRAFEAARKAFVGLDEALHDGPQSKAVRALNLGVVDAEVAG